MTTVLSPADIAAHEAASFVRVAPLPKLAAEALDRLERAFAADDHEKVKDPLPPRPRGPHPYGTGVA